MSILLASLAGEWKRSCWLTLAAPRKPFACSATVAGVVALAPHISAVPVRRGLSGRAGWLSFIFGRTGSITAGGRVTHKTNLSSATVLRMFCTTGRTGSPVGGDHPGHPVAASGLAASPRRRRTGRPARWVLGAPAFRVLSRERRGDGQRTRLGTTLRRAVSATVSPAALRMCGVVSPTWRIRRCSAISGEIPHAA
jgi:hypothetical protein